MTPLPAHQDNGPPRGSVFVIQSIEALRVFFDPLRARIMRELSDRPRSARELASDLSLPQTKLYYHLHLLEEHGLVVMSSDDQRPSSERVYEATAQDFVVHSSLLSMSEDPATSALDRRLSTVLDSTRVEIRRSAQRGAIDLRRSFPDRRALLIQHTHATIPSSLVSTFKERLDQLIAEFDALGAAGTSMESEYRAAFGFTVCLYPTDDDPGTQDLAP
jgi:DNA-binding transcriptional ArsR family regulator